MKKTIRVSLSFATQPIEQKNNLAILVIVCLKTNALFPNLPLTIVALTALQTALQDAITAAEHGGTVETAAKIEAADAMTSALRQTAAYVQSLAPTLTLSQVLSSGFDVVNPNNTPSPLIQPVFTLDNSMTTQVAVRTWVPLSVQLRLPLPGFSSSRNSLRGCNELPVRDPSSGAQKIIAPSGPV